jgi:hypothetical protein
MHCCGKAHRWTATSSTLPTQILGIEWRSLPKTFQDAHNFHSRTWYQVYLDRLPAYCTRQTKKIGQRSLALWVPCTQGLSYYSSGVKGRWHTWLFPTPTNQLKPKLPKNLDGAETEVSIRKWSAPYDDRGHLSCVHTILPLFNRAWLRRERLLSRRTLNFCQ